MFDAVLISVFLVAEIEAESDERTRELGRPIDQERPLLDLLFVLEFTEKQQRELAPRLKQPHVKDFVHRCIDRSVQPVALAVDLNHRLVHRDVIGSAPLRGCTSVFCSQL
jgi:hypothetical protein